MADLTFRMDSLEARHETGTFTQRSQTPRRAPLALNPAAITQAARVPSIYRDHGDQNRRPRSHYVSSETESRNSRSTRRDEAGSYRSSRKKWSEDIAREHIYRLTQGEALSVNHQQFPADSPGLTETIYSEGSRNSRSTRNRRSSLDRRNREQEINTLYEQIHQPTSREYAPQRKIASAAGPRRVEAIYSGDTSAQDRIDEYNKEKSSLGRSQRDAVDSRQALRKERSSNGQSTRESSRKDR